MTGAAAGDPEEGTGAPSGPSDPAGPFVGLAALLALGLVLRIIIVNALPGSGFGVDLDAFRYWAANLAAEGPFGFYERGFFADYTPGYLYLLWLVGAIGGLVGWIGDLIKVPAILADLGIAWLIGSMAQELGATRRRALFAAGLLAANLRPESLQERPPRRHLLDDCESSGIVIRLAILLRLFAQRSGCLESCQTRADTHVNAVTEGQMLLDVLAHRIKVIRIREDVLIAIGRAVGKEHRGALRQRGCLRLLTLRRHLTMA